MGKIIPKMKETEEIQIGQVFAQSQANSEQLNNLGEKLDSAIRELSGAIRASNEQALRMIEQLRQSLTPKSANIWAAVGACVAFVGLMASGVASVFYLEISHLEASTEKLDTKLQREQILLTDKVEQAVKNEDQVSRERHEEALERIKELREWQTWRVQHDLLKAERKLE
jgi:hypothetical protein